MTEKLKRTVISIRRWILECLLVGCVILIVFSLILIVFSLILLVLSLILLVFTFEVFNKEKSLGLRESFVFQQVVHQLLSFLCD